jgi:hypothetical protein
MNGIVREPRRFVPVVFSLDATILGQARWILTEFLVSCETRRWLPTQRVNEGFEACLCVCAALVGDSWRLFKGPARYLARFDAAVIVSHTSDRVEFWEYLADRTVNLIPVDTLDEVLDVVDAYTQTVGIFPESLREVVRHKGALHGGQRFVSLGTPSTAPA